MRKERSEDGLIHGRLPSGRLCGSVQHQCLSGFIARISMQIPRSKTVKAHPMAGLACIILTFGRLGSQTAAHALACGCGQKAVLKVWPCWAGDACMHMLDRLCQLCMECVFK